MFLDNLIIVVESIFILTLLILFVGIVYWAVEYAPVYIPTVRCKLFHKKYHVYSVINSYTLLRSVCVKCRMPLADIDLTDELDKYDAEMGCNNATLTIVQSSIDRSMPIWWVSPSTQEQGYTSASARVQWGFYENSSAR